VLAQLLLAHRRQARRQRRARRLHGTRLVLLRLLLLLLVLRGRVAFATRATIVVSGRLITGGSFSAGYCKSWAHATGTARHESSRTLPPHGTHH
jgi:hypothetical protein